MPEAKKLLRLVNVEALKRRLGESGGEVIAYPELLRTCELMGVAKSEDEAAAFARALDDAGVVLMFRDKVYLHPNKVLILFYLFFIRLVFDSFCLPILIHISLFRGKIS